MLFEVILDMIFKNHFHFMFSTLNRFQTSKGREKDVCTKKLTLEQKNCLGVKITGSDINKYKKGRLCPKKFALESEVFFLGGGFMSCF